MSFNWDNLDDLTWDTLGPDMAQRTAGEAPAPYVRGRMYGDSGGNDETVPDGVPPTWLQLQSFIAKMDFEESAALQQILAAHGFLTGKYKVGGWYDKTEEALRDAFAASRADRKPFMRFLFEGLPAEDVPAFYGGKGAGGGGGYSGPMTYSSSESSTSTNTAIQLSSRATARAVLESALANELGREPTKRETTAFLRALNQKEEANPTVTTSTTDSSSTSVVDQGKKGSDTDTTSSSNTTTTSRDSNVDPNQMAERFAKKENPQEWKRFQDAQYFDVLAQMLGM